jgi:CheY-like chemotaxis protein
MSEEVLEKVFDPFFTTKEIGEGTGLGLSTVGAIAKSHGGFVNVYSEPGQGSTFRLYFPAATSEDPLDGVPAIEPRRGNNELVLVVDDEHSVRQVTRQTLEAFGYRVVTARDGAEAVAVFGKVGDTIDVVLTDIMMPVMDGVATIAALQHLDPTVKIIAASGLGSNGGVARAADKGIEHFLPKPYTAEALLDILHRVINKRNP